MPASGIRKFILLVLSVVVRTTRCSRETADYPLNATLWLKNCRSAHVISLILATTGLHRKSGRDVNALICRERR